MLKRPPRLLLRDDTEHQFYPLDSWSIFNQGARFRLEVDNALHLILMSPCGYYGDLAISSSQWLFD